VWAVDSLGAEELDDEGNDESQTRAGHEDTQKNGQDACGKLLVHDGKSPFSYVEYLVFGSLFLSFLES
jgi:hypothetical protein